MSTQDRLGNGSVSTGALRGIFDPPATPLTAKSIVTTAAIGRV
jgi:hypothetical protein